MKSKSDPIIILGMHRSGTSMVTSLLHHCGLTLGSDAHLMQASPTDNPKGYWENQHITDLNDAILAQFGGTWDHPPVFPPQWTQLPEIRLIAARFEGLFSTDFQSQPYWGWKDPRNNLTLPFWMELFPNAKLLICLRNPIAVAQSLSTGKAMRDLDFNSALKLWQTYYEGILQYKLPSELLITHYDSYFYDAKSELARITSQLGISVDKKKIDDAIDNIEIDLRHNLIPDDLINNKNVSAPIMEYYYALSAQAGDVYHTMRSDDAYQRKLIKGYNQELYYQLYVEDRAVNEDLQKHIEQLKLQIENYETQIEQLNKDLSDNEAIQALNTQLEDLQQKHADDLITISDLRKQKLELKAQHQTTLSDLSHSQHQTDALKNEIAILTERLANARPSEEFLSLADQLQQAQNRIQYLDQSVQYHQQRAQTFENDFNTIYHSLLVRTFARPIWKLRRIFAPEGSRAYLRYRRWKRRIRRLFVRDAGSPPLDDIELSPKPKKASKQTNVSVQNHISSVQSDTQSKALSLPEVAFPATQQNIIVCTIISKNYLAHARALMESVQVHHGEDVHRVVLLVDELNGEFQPDQEPFDIWLAKDLGIPRWQHFSMKYDIMELNTAVKPYLLERLFDQYSAERVIYFDPDILVYNPLIELFALLDRYTAVLTPHLLSRLPDDGAVPNNIGILQAGVYNLGFFAISRRGQWREILKWWQEELYTKCIVAFEIGYFVDQSWMSMLPAIFDHIYILRHPGYNIAYWNLHERELQYKYEKYWVNEQPLYFFHFSGFSPKQPDSISKHQTRFQMSDLNSTFRQEFKNYRTKLLNHGYETVLNWSYAYGQFPNGVSISQSIRRMLLEVDPSGERWLDPYQLYGIDTFWEWTQSRMPIYPQDHPILSSWALQFWQLHPSLQKAFPGINSSLTYAISYARWLMQSNHIPTLDSSLEPIRVKVEEYDKGINQAQQITPKIHKTQPPDGVNIIGYAKSETGVGQITRNTLTALQTTNIPKSIFPITTDDRARKQAVLPDNLLQGTPYSVNVIHANADMTQTVFEQLRDENTQGRYHIGFWMWELEKFPEQWYPAIEYYDEIWTPTEFVQQAISSFTTKPVTLVPTTILPSSPDPLGRAVLGLPDDAFIVLFMFDAHSIYERKNPLAVVDAFAKAFSVKERRSKVRLVIKVNNIDDLPDGGKCLRQAIQEVNGILFDNYMDAAHVSTLLSSCDAYISLHRSEGYGLTLAEAMYFGKPVITTAYSGNMTFTNEGNSCLVPYTLKELEENYGPYTAGNVWAEPDVDAAASLLRRVYDDSEYAIHIGEEGAKTIHTRCTPKVVGRELKAILKARGLLAHIS